MGKTLFIVEKPKVAAELMKSPRFRNSTKHTGSKPYFGYYENDNYIVSWCAGHLLELKYPEEVNEKYKEFSFEHLPIIFKPEYKKKPESEEQINMLVQLLNRDDVEQVVNACDSDKEGELIYREIYEFAGANKKQYRLFIASYEPAELEAALNRLLPGEDFDALAAAASARQYLDYMIGINVTRGSTTKLADNQFLLSSGRVQMCLLNEIRQREIAIQNYKEQTYYKLKVSTAPGFSAIMKSEEQIVDPFPLLQLGNRIKETQLIVQSFKENNRKKKPKLLYNLTDLYKDAYAKLKTSAEVAKKHVQTLYEEGYISYPRTSSRHLPTEKVEKVKEVFSSLIDTMYGDMIAMVNESTITKKHTTFNDELVDSHFAIMPTGKKYNGTERNQLEQQLYHLIVQRFIGNFMPPAIYLVREAQFVDQEGNEYLAKERVLQEKGFLSVFQEDIEEDSIDAFHIPILSENDQILIVNHDLVESKTQKPSLHTESSILTFMETAGRKLDDEHLKELMKGKRIGTVATEESFVPKLQERGYITVTSGKIEMTEIGRSFIDHFPVDDVKDPSYTAEMEGLIHLIENKELTYEEFVENTNVFVQKVVGQLATIDTSVSQKIVNTWSKQIEVCSCICKKGKIIDKGKFYGCSNYLECETSIPKKIKEKDLPKEQVKKLFEKQKTDLIKGFKSEDKTFDAYIVFHEGKIKMVFPTQEELSLGKCPKCKKGDVLARKSFYGCSEYKSGCDYSLPARIKEKNIPGSQIKKLIAYGTTDFIHGFKSEKGEFTAAIQMKDGKLTFKFPTLDDRTIGKCPVCQSRVLIGKTTYLCENYKKTCEFIIPGSFFEKSITNNHVKKLLEKNLTDEIKGFKSQKTGKMFNARLSYNSQEKRLNFIFNKQEG